MASSARIDELQKKFDENPRRYFAPLANEYRKAGDLERAIHICQEYLPQQPGHMSGHIVYGQALFEQDRLDESRQVFETALSLDPENLIALRHLGDIARRVGDSRTARSWYQRVLEADPRNEEIAQIMMTLLSTPSVAQPGITSGSSYESSEMTAPPHGGESGELAGFQPTGFGTDVEQPQDRSGLSVGPELAALPERQEETPAWTAPAPVIPEEELLDLNDFDFSVGGVRLSELGATPAIDPAPAAEEPRAEAPNEPDIEAFTETAAFVARDETEVAPDAPLAIEIETSAVVIDDAPGESSAEFSIQSVESAIREVASEDPVFEADPFAIAAAPAVDEPIVEQTIVFVDESPVEHPIAESAEIPPLETVESSRVAASIDSIPGLESYEHGVSAPEEASNALEFEEFFIASPSAPEPVSAAEETPMMDSVADTREPVVEAAADSFDPFAETIFVVEEAVPAAVEEPVVESAAAVIDVVDERVIEADEPAALESFDAPAIIESFEMPVIETMSGEAFGTESLDVPDELPAELLVELSTEPFVASDLEIETASDVDWLTPAAQAPAVDEIVAATSEPEWQSNAAPWDTPPVVPAISEPEPEPAAAPVEAEAFVTETMAELYLQQGHLDAALDIYKKLVEQRPDEPQLVARLRVLQDQFFGRPTPIISPAVVPPPPAPATLGPTIREFLSGIVAARPTPMYAETIEGEPPVDVVDAAPSDGGDSPPIAAEPASIEEEFGEPYEPMPELAAPASATPTSIPVVEAALEAVIDFSEQPMAASRTPSAPAETVRGSIDALFSNASGSLPDANSASPLVEAFTPVAAETDPLQGMPAHKASNELSLDHVFKSTQAARTDEETEAFSFDQFFAEDLAEGTGKTGSQTPPASRQGADDIAQFNNWLNGLKKT